MTGLVNLKWHLRQTTSSCVVDLDRVVEAKADQRLNRRLSAGACLRIVLEVKGAVDRTGVSAPRMTVTANSNANGAHLHKKMTDRANGVLRERQPQILEGVDLYRGCNTIIPFRGKHKSFQPMQRLFSPGDF